VSYEDYPDEEWVEEEDEAGDDLLVCPSCGAHVHEETQQCPHCGDWIVPAYPHAPGKRIIWVVVVILLVIAMILWAVF
jgi:hypothetical protein